MVKPLRCFVSPLNQQRIESATCFRNDGLAASMRRYSVIGGPPASVAEDFHAFYCFALFSGTRRTTQGEKRLVRLVHVEVGDLSEIRNWEWCSTDVPAR